MELLVLYTSDQRKLQGYIFHISLWSGIPTTGLIALIQADSLLTSHPQPTVTERSTVYNSTLCNIQLWVSDFNF